jgi:hypothetical protein
MHVSSQKIALPLLATSHKSGTAPRNSERLEAHSFRKILKIPTRSRMKITNISSVVLITFAAEA